MIPRKQHYPVHRLTIIEHQTRSHTLLDSTTSCPLQPPLAQRLSGRIHRGGQKASRFTTPGLRSPDLVLASRIDRSASVWNLFVT